MNAGEVDLGSHETDTPDGNAVDWERITGPVPDQVAQALTYLRISPMISTTTRRNGNGHHDYPGYADRTLWKAIVNAVVHRDYEVQGSHIAIWLLPDRIEFQNPQGSYSMLRGLVCQSHIGASYQSLSRRLGHRQPVQMQAPSRRNRHTWVTSVRR